MSDHNDEIGLDIAEAYVVVWPRNCNDCPTVDLDIRACPGVTIEIAMSAAEATQLADAILSAAKIATTKAQKWKDCHS
jgi:hypothetical protein